MTDWTDRFDVMTVDGFNAAITEAIRRSEPQPERAKNHAPAADGDYWRALLADRRHQ